MERLSEPVVAMLWAAGLAAKKAAFLLPWGAIALPMSYVELQTALGERGIAILFACIANTIRWVKERPGRGDVVTGYMTASFAAFIAANFRVPLIDTLVTIPKEDLAMFNGAIIGTLSTAGYTFIIVFAKSYMEKLSARAGQ